MSDPTWLSVLPPVLAIALAIITRQVFVSLFMGIWLGWTILRDWDPLSGLVAALDACVGVFGDGGNTKVIIFSALVGALIALTQASGGVGGFVDWVTDRKLVTTRRRAFLLSWILGVVIFVESSMTALVNGAVCRPIFDKLKISREKLAYLCDSTSAPICILIPLNAWGAYITRLLGAEGYEEPVAILVASMPYNLYAILALALSLYLVLSGRDFGPMARAEARAAETGAVLRPGATPMMGEELTGLEPGPGVPRRARNFLLPVGTMVLMMPIGLYVTGDGDLMKGSGSTSVFWAVLAGTFLGAALMIGQRIGTLRSTTDVFFKGVGGLMPLAVLMVLAFAIGSMTRELGTGTYVAGLASANLPPAILPLILFVIACFIAFATGTSWGTFAVMIPIAVPMVAVLPGSEALLLAAVLGGGIFGDHCSPISDTTIISSMASGSDHIDHVNTQLPYALSAAGVAGVLYLILGWLAVS